MSTAGPDLEEGRPFPVGGEWRRVGRRRELRSPWRQEPIGSYWEGGAEDLDAALHAAQKAFSATRRLPAHARIAVLEAVADGIAAQRETLARQVMAEAGKPIRLARIEIDRARDIFRWAAGEAGRIGGEWIDLDGDPAGAGTIGLTRRFPVGVVGAITPFNFPFHLVAHKVAPCIAAGAAMVLKPAPQTPLSALSIATLVEAAGYPPGGLNVVPCAPEVASSLATDPRVRVLTFTGSAAVGWELEAAASRRRVVLELGGVAGVIVHRDADIDRAATRCVAGGFHYAGQSCISVQRILVHESIYDAFRDRVLEQVAALEVGDPAGDEVWVGPLITPADAGRVVAWIGEATAAGARVLTGGDRDGSLVQPAVLEAVDPAARVVRREAFGPLVVLERYRDFGEAVRRLNDTPFGLQAGLFTRDLGAVGYAFREIEVGGLMVNEVPTFRVDRMPYGGVKESGTGREGPRYAIEAMTEPRLLVVHQIEPPA